MLRTITSLIVCCRKSYVNRQNDVFYYKLAFWIKIGVSLPSKSVKKEVGSIGLLPMIWPVIGLVLIYVALIFVLPANAVTKFGYDLNPAHYHTTLFLMNLPYMIVWLLAFVSLGAMTLYSNMIKRTPECVDFQRIVKGIKFLAYGLPIVAILSLVVNSIGNSYEALKPSSVIIVNYLMLIVPLVAFPLMRSGTGGLIRRNNIHFRQTSFNAVILIFVAVGTIYSYFTFRKLGLDSLYSDHNAYYLPVWLIITTIAMPHLFAWFSGLFAACELIVYGREVPGVLYRQAVAWIGAGVSAIVAGSIGLQYLRSVIPRSEHFTLDMAVTISVLVYGVLVIGFILTTIGALKLKKLEQV